MPVPTETVRKVDRQIRETTTYRADPGHDLWNHLTAIDGRMAGDCEDWAIRASDALLALGEAPEDVAIATCDTRGGESVNHAVCVVMTDAGLMTCGDTYSARPEHVGDTGYRFDRAMRRSEHGVWREWL